MRGVSGDPSLPLMYEGFQRGLYNFAKLKAALNPSLPYYSDVWGVSERPLIEPRDAERRQLLGWLYPWSGYKFQAWTGTLSPDKLNHYKFYNEIHTENLFWYLLNEPEPDYIYILRFESLITIQIWFDLIKLRKGFSVCSLLPFARYPYPINAERCLQHLLSERLRLSA